MFTPLLLAGALTLGFLPSERADVPADARWVVHVDLRAALGSDLVQRLAAQEGGLRLDGPEWGEVRERLGFDPLEEIVGLTVFGSTADPEEAVALVRTTPRIETALERLALLLRRAPAEVEGLPLTRWSESEGSQDELYSYLAQRADSDERMLVVSRHRAQLARAVRALRGEAPRLSAGETGQPGTFLHATILRGLDELAREADAPQVARLLRSLELELGEAGGRAFFDLAAETEGAEAAGTVAQVLQGGVAMLRLVGQSQPEAAALLPLLDALEVEASGPRVGLRFSAEVDTLLALARRASQGEWARADFRQAPPGRPPAKDAQGWH